MAAKFFALLDGVRVIVDLHKGFLRVLDPSGTVLKKVFVRDDPVITVQGDTIQIEELSLSIEENSQSLIDLFNAVRSIQHNWMVEGSNLTIDSGLIPGHPNPPRSNSKPTVRTMCEGREVIIELNKRRVLFKLLDGSVQDKIWIQRDPEPDDGFIAISKNIIFANGREYEVEAESHDELDHLKAQLRLFEDKLSRYKLNFLLTEDSDRARSVCVEAHRETEKDRALKNVDPGDSQTQSLNQRMLSEGWLKGEIAYIRLHRGLIHIKRTSLFADLALGPVRGDKIIPVRNIQAIQYKPATAMVAGALQFIVAGDVSTTKDSWQAIVPGSDSGAQLVNSLFGRRTARATHANTITFKRSQEPEFLAFYETVLEMIGDLNTPESSIVRPEALGSVASEVEKLATLYEKGLLSESEFVSAKQRLLGE